MARATRLALPLIFLLRVAPSEQDKPPRCSREHLLVNATDGVHAVSERYLRCGVAILDAVLPREDIGELHRAARRFLYADATLDGQQWADVRHEDCWKDERRKVVIPPPVGPYGDNLTRALATSNVVRALQHAWGEDEIDMSFLTVLSSPPGTRATVYHTDNSASFAKLQLLLHDLESDDQALVSVLPGCFPGSRTWQRCADCQEARTCPYARRQVLQPWAAGSAVLYRADLLHAGLSRPASLLKPLPKIVLDVNFRRGSRRDEAEDMATEFGPRAFQYHQAREQVWAQSLAPRPAAVANGRKGAQQKSEEL